MKENSIFALLLRAQWWVSGGIALLIAIIASALMPRQYAVYGIFTGMPFMIVCIMVLWRKRGEPSATRVAEIMQATRAMSWKDFSVEIERALLRDGFEVTRIDQPHADFSIISGGRKALVSCKRWKAASNGIEPLRDLHNAVEAGGADYSFYITAGEFTPTAMQFAVAHKMRLVHGAGLAKLLREMTVLKSKG
ncbi:restriction endonuclease [Herminiimonas fonticola]|nr:restriction endonuclease [Herminiimonas fonticola]